MTKQENIISEKMKEGERKQCNLER